MIKKIFIFLFITVLLSSCGKKGDPIYNEEKRDSKIISTRTSTIS